MDDVISIIVVAVLFVLSFVRQSKKNKLAHQERMRKMAEQQAQEMQQKEPERRSIVIPTVPSMPTPHPETVRVQEILKSSPVEVKASSKKKQAKPQKSQKFQPKPQQEPASQPTESSKFDFDMERAVVEAEILKPKYLEY